MMNRALLIARYRSLLSQIINYLFITANFDLYESSDIFISQFLTEPEEINMINNSNDNTLYIIGDINEINHILLNLIGSSDISINKINNQMVENISMNSVSKDYMTLYVITNIMYLRANMISNSTDYLKKYIAGVILAFIQSLSSTSQLVNTFVESVNDIELNDREEYTHMYLGYINGVIVDNPLLLKDKTSGSLIIKSQPIENINMELLLNILYGFLYCDILDVLNIYVSTADNTRMEASTNLFNVSQSDYTIYEKEVTIVGCTIRKVTPNWEYPVYDNGNLTITQAYKATKNNNKLEVM